MEGFGSYRFLVAGHVEVPGQDDGEMFHETLQAMEIMGFTEDERIGKGARDLLLSIFLSFHPFSLSLCVCLFNIPFYT